MKKRIHGVVPPALSFVIHLYRIAKEGNNKHENDYMACGGGRRARRFAPVREMRC